MKLYFQPDPGPWWANAYIGFIIAASVLAAVCVAVCVAAPFVWFVDTCEHKFMDWWRKR